MTRPVAGTNRQLRILKALIAHGPLTMPGIREHIRVPRHEDLRALRSAGYITEAGMVPARRFGPVKELPTFRATHRGVAYATAMDQQAVQVAKIASKASPKSTNSVLPKMTTKLVPVVKAEIVYTENTKYTKYEPKYEFTPYQPPKQFMECVR